MDFKPVFNKEKRYALDLDMYVYAKDDEEAKQFSENIAQMLRNELDNQAKVKALHETPFASTTSRKIEIKA